MYGFACEHCDGTVEERRVDREALRHKGSFVILEDVPIGVCGKCGALFPRLDPPPRRRNRPGHSRDGADRRSPH